MRTMSHNTLALLVPMIVVIGVAFLLPVVVQAEEPCLRGGSGNCVELGPVPSVDTHATSLTNPLGTGNASSFFPLSDGTLVAAVAERVVNPAGWGNSSRYEIFLYTSNDNGYTWAKANIENKGDWYVDEIGNDAYLYPSVGSQYYYGAKYSPGFLGYSVTSQNDTSTGKEYIFVTHAAACSTDSNTAIVFGNTFSGGATYNCSGSMFTDGAIFLDAVSYDSTDKSFIQIGDTTAITRTSSRRAAGNNSPQISVTTSLGYGTMVGASHPDIAIGKIDETTGNASLWISYSAYIGDLCAVTTNSSLIAMCAYQNGPGGSPVMGTSYTQLWVRHVNFDFDTAPFFTSDTSTPAFPTIDNTDNKRVDEKSTGTKLPAGYACIGDASPSAACNDERYNYISSIAVTRGGGTTEMPVVFYGYSKHGDSESDMQWATYDPDTNTWNSEGSLKDAVSWKTSQTPLSLHVAGDTALGVKDIATNIIPSVDAVSGGAYGFYSWGEWKRHEVIHLTAYADMEQKNGKLRAVPVYIRYLNDNLLPWELIEGVYLGDQATKTISRIPGSTADCASDEQECVSSFVEAGGPSIGLEKNRAWITLPGAQLGTLALSKFLPESVDVFSTEITPPGVDIASSKNANWFDPITTDWITKEGPTSELPIYSQMTFTTNASTYGVGGPVMQKYVFSTESYDVMPILTNLFNPPTLFVRAENAPAKCTNLAGQGCSIGSAGDPYSNGIRGWAWADTVGWISLSCDNLKSCTRRSYSETGEAWSSREGGLYYGVRAMMVPQINTITLLGSMWSERIGYLSFGRADNVSSANPCGNPPEGYQITDEAQCAILQSDVSDDAATMTITTIDGSPINFPTSGSLLVDEEIINYTYANPGDVVGNVATLTLTRRGDGTDGTYLSLANEWVKSVSRNHSQLRQNGSANPVFWISTGDVTSNSFEGTDVYKAINEYDTTTFDVLGWGRADSWKQYQVDYCGGGVGEGYAPPCDKEWGWIKLSGLWESVHRGTFYATTPQTSCGTDKIYVSSVDGYPDPASGETEKVYLDLGCLPGTCPVEWSYSSVNRQDRYFQLSSQTLPSTVLTCSVADNGKEVSWITNLAGGGILASYDSIPLNSVNGFNSSGKVEILEDKNADFDVADPGEREVVKYGQVDFSSDPPELQLTDRGQDGTTAQDFTSAARVVPIKESGTYQTYGLPVSTVASELTLAGFGWSAPNTDLPTADPFSSRYRDNISGFGWLNFQPSKFEQIYPFLKTLFNDVYVGNGVEIVGPGNIDPRQYTSTYLLQTNGSISPFIPDLPASSGQYQQCFDSCSGVETCETQCRDLFLPTEAPGVSLDPAAGSVFGRLPDTEALSTWVTGCRNYLGELIGGTGSCPPADEQARHIGLDGTTTWAYTLTDMPDENLAVSGINKYGHHVVLCRAYPSLSGQNRSLFVFGDGGYAGNPEECRWQRTKGYWQGILTQDYTQGDGYVCVNVTDGAMNPAGSAVQFGSNISNYSIASPETGVCSGSGGTELTLTSQELAFVDVPLGSDAVDYDPNFYYKVRHSHLGLPTVYILPTGYNNQGPHGYFNVYDTPLQYNDGDRFIDWDVDSNGFMDDLIEPTGTQKESGAVTFVFPGVGFLLASPSRYCPEGHPDLPCRAEEDQSSAIEVSSIHQIASAGFISHGSIGVLEGFGTGRHAYTGKSYQVGSYLLFKDDDDQFKNLYGVSGNFMLPYTLATGLQYIVKGLVIAPNFQLYGQYYLQNEDGVVIEPSEKFEYDGRVLLNPPPGFEDLSTGLPTISKASP